jgi:hypothetical protein
MLADVRKARVVELDAETSGGVGLIRIDGHETLEILIVKPNNCYAHYTPCPLMIDRRLYPDPRLRS